MSITSIASRVTCRGLEVRVMASLLSGDTAGRIIDKQRLKKVKAILVKVRAQALRVITGPFGEGGLEVRVGCYTRPNLLSRSSQEANEMSVKLV